jgi:predicted transport protein
LLLIELVHAPSLGKIQSPKVKSGDEAVAASTEEANDPYHYQRIGYRISQTTGVLKDLFQAVWDFLASLGDDVQVGQRQQYIAFKRLKNFACLEVYPEKKVVTLFIKVDPTTIKLEEGFTRDMRNIGHYGTGDLQVNLRNMADFEKAQPLLRKSYEGQ